MAPRRMIGTVVRGALLASLLALGACGGGGGGGNDNGSAANNDPPVVAQADAPPAGTTNQPYSDPTAYSTAANASLSQADEGVAVTHHEIQLHGAPLRYTATAGHLLVRDSGGQPAASFFYVAYTLDGQQASQRPVTFFYNGGPGSASVWLHLGSFGPKRLATGDPSTATPKPFVFVDNQETLLSTSDLVFVDAVGTGYSQAVAPHTNSSFWGVDVDAAAFRDFVQRYVAVNGRAASPKFLFGESYGTTRSAVLAQLLETAGAHLAGVVLQSSVLDYNANCGVVGEGSCASYLPSYAAIGAYYQRVTPPPASLPAFMQQMDAFADQTYVPALNAFLLNGTAPPASLLGALSADTGESTAQWQADFNLDPTTFQHTLLPGEVIGRYDGRMSAANGSALASEGDPSSTFIDSQFASGIASYLRNNLQYANGSTYVTLGNAINSWDFHHDGRSLPDTVPDLATAFALNRALKVLSLNGYHDLATPFHQTELDLARLGAGAPVAVKSYAGGHMTYLDDSSRLLELSDLQAFYGQVLGH
jgi:carboxypeptidase C (cathepsin A)